MKTDYKKLTWHDTCVVIMITLGVVLVGFELFVSVPETAQQRVVEGFEILDMHEEIALNFNRLDFVLSVSQTYMEEFNLAFTELLVIPQEDLEFPNKVASAFENFLQFTETVAAAYQINNNIQNTSLSLAPVGQVLGASVAAENANFASEPIIQYSFDSSYAKNFLVLIKINK